MLYISIFFLNYEHIIIQFQFRKPTYFIFDDSSKARMFAQFAIFEEELFVLEIFKIMKHLRN